MRFEDALALVPHWWFLERNVDKVLRGDMFMPPEAYGEWRPVVHENEIGTIYDHHSCLVIRPIPDKVRKAVALEIQHASPMISSSVSALWKWVQENRNA